MITTKKINAKAFQELVLYYLRERITHKNLEVKHLVATNINEWFIFDATLFDRLFAQNKNLVKQFNDFEAARLADTKTDFFYKQIAEPFIDTITSEIEFTYFNIQDFTPLLRGDGGVLKHINNPPHVMNDNSLVALYKIFSPEHLLKLPFTNDSNSLDKRFYSELLHIIGLTETKEGSKKLIERNKPGERHTGTILEDAIIQLDSLDKLSRLDKPSQYGNNKEEQLFNVALELSITWINRILFLKLLEAQLITYHKGDKSYSFLNLDKIKNYDDLNSLFFQVLARKYDERNEDVKKIFEKVPYLNSSLFEPTDIEQVTLFISNLKDDKTIPIFSQTVLKDQQGKKRTGNISTLQYLFEFLDAYDFGAEGGSDIQEDNKTLINASVLGLIFEKINGYKDGSFFTPGFITMYMCRETIRKAVVQKFNEAAAPLLRGVGGVSNLQKVNEKAKEGERRQIIPYNPALKELARELRNNSTKSEIILWKELKGKFEGKYDFHRQKPLDNYIADFFCHELKLVIEIDGESHNWEETQQKDFEKECRFNELGLNVLRFPDSDIFKHLESTLESIRQYIEGFEKGDLSSFLYEDTPLNPLSRGDFAVPDPLSREALPQPLSRVEFKSLDDIYDQIGEGRLFTRQQANDIVNSIKICDPAVGSGHFLVSALNEMIAVKNDLKILQDRDGKRLKEYQVEVVNDELIVTDEEGELFEYNPSNKESQRIQETLFHEKQTIIENCLFGVDINTNSVKICRLRLWIELLKNAYYKHLPDPPQGGNTPLSRGVGGVLETLPNIDINIKCGNSLVSRFAIDANLSKSLKSLKWDIKTYQGLVHDYQNATDKEAKRGFLKLINDIKNDFRVEIHKNDPLRKKLNELSGQLFIHLNQKQLFALSDKEKEDFEARTRFLESEIEKRKKQIDEIENNKIYDNAFEWRFEFPEVLNDDGDFVGFDVVIGNPPYVNSKGEKFENSFKSYALETFKTSKYQIDTYILFIEKAISLMNKNGFMTYITPNAWLNNLFLSEVRKYFIENITLSEICNMPSSVFDEAVVDTIILSGSKSKSVAETTIKNYSVNGFELVNHYKQSDFLLNENNSINIFLDNNAQALLSKIESKANKLQSFTSIARGVGVYHKRVGHTKELISQDPYQSKEKIDNTFVPYLRGKNIKPYVIDWKNDSFISYGKWLAEPREPKYFEGNRILLRQIPGDKLISAFIDSDFITDQSVFIARFENDEINPVGVLGIINSKLLAFYFRNKYSEFDDLFPKVKLQHFKDFPIRTSPEQIFNEICTIVSEIHSQKTNDPNFDLRILEEKIDKLVYQLYELTEEEIKIVEGNG